MSKVGILGGTFDPFTLSHLKIAVEAAKKLDIVFIVPTICDYYRSNSRKLFTFNEKVVIITQMISNAPGDIRIDTVEHNKDETWRFINTMEYFKQKFPNDELYVILGEDSYSSFQTWFRYDDILRFAKLLVVKRFSGEFKKTIPCELIDIGEGFKSISATIVRDKLINELLDMYLSDTEFYN